jgi:hypothetical protein
MTNATAVDARSLATAFTKFYSLTDPKVSLDRSYFHKLTLAERVDSLRQSIAYTARDLAVEMTRLAESMAGGDKHLSAPMAGSNASYLPMQLGELNATLDAFWTRLREDHGAEGYDMVHAEYFKKAE